MELPLFTLEETVSGDGSVHIAVRISASAAEGAGGAVLQNAGQLLEQYVHTDDGAALMANLSAVRDYYLADLDQVGSPAEVVGLIAWLLRDHDINHQGESLAETADRLCDLDAVPGGPDYQQLIYHIRDALERLDDLELFAADPDM
ncbi:MAG: hypothetical protein OIF57_02945 [Marinobacterium sp.]|nr:hypothetical protein [Marinobacterium sp.]